MLEPTKIAGSDLKRAIRCGEVQGEVALDLAIRTPRKLLDERREKVAALAVCCAGSDAELVVGEAGCGTWTTDQSSAGGTGRTQVGPKPVQRSAPHCGVNDEDNIKRM
jgi:hypothetical protein